MNCDACANTIKTLVEKEDGVRAASVSFSERSARVLYNPKIVAEERLVETIQKRGFRVVAREQEASPTADCAFGRPPTPAGLRRVQ